MQNLVLIIFFMLLCSGCNLREREQALEKRAAALDQKEQELALREKSIQLKEEEQARLKNLSDSAILADTTAVIDERITGNWQVRMVCTETTCTGSAVGDTRTETWQISYQGRSIIARAMSGDQLIRTYTGSYNGNVIELTEESTNPETGMHSRMIVRLRISDRNLIEGQREIVREGSCKIVFSVQMTRAQN